MYTMIIDGEIVVSDFKKGMCQLMIYVGIDIVKLNHFAVAISSDFIFGAKNAVFIRLVAFRKRLNP